jgi:hemerythrin
MCAALEAEAPLPASLAPLELLEDLASDLSRHFAAEEADAYFGTIAEEAPLLATRIAQLTTEHATMLGAIADLCRFADDTARHRELSRAARELVAQLERHERDESLLLRELLAVAQ